MGSGQTWSTQSYDRKIKYLDYLENGVRCRGVGYIKMEQRDGQCSINLQIKGLYRRDHFTRPLLLLTGGEEKELCRLQLADGGAKICMEKLDSHNLDGKGLCYEQVAGLRVPVSEGKEIRCLWGAQSAPEAQRSVKTQPPMPIQEETEQPVESEKPAQEEMRVVEETAIPETQQTGPETPIPETQQTGAEVSMPEMQEDKWTQLWVIYPHIRPFEDEREYLSMGPGDFVILPGRYYKLVNNSFLLHGYYNYHHLIMTRVEQRNNARYYIGVPGNYYEKEKKIAIMFGFESFECRGEPAREGDFGYYLIPVEL